MASSPNIKWSSAQLRQRMLLSLLIGEPKQVRFAPPAEQATSKHSLKKTISGTSLKSKKSIPRQDSNHKRQGLGQWPDQPNRSQNEQAPEKPAQNIKIQGWGQRPNRNKPSNQPNRSQNEPAPEKPVENIKIQGWGQRQNRHKPSNQPNRSQNEPAPEKPVENIKIQGWGQRQNRHKRSQNSQNTSNQNSQNEQTSDSAEKPNIKIQGWGQRKRRNKEDPDG